MYAPSVTNRAFADLDRFTIRIDDVDYPVFRRTALGVRCIVCNDKEVLVIEDHLQTLCHEQESDDNAARANVKLFHNFWSQQRESVQQEQIFIVNETCVICQKAIPFENVNSHTTSKSHQNKVAAVSNDMLHMRLG